MACHVLSCSAQPVNGENDKNSSHRWLSVRSRALDSYRTPAGHLPHRAKRNGASEAGCDGENRTLFVARLEPNHSVYRLRSENEQSNS
eukprot:jgi/Psemu1/300364/fgenesh1_kg.11_\